MKVYNNLSEKNFKLTDDLMKSILCLRNLTKVRKTSTTLYLLIIVMISIIASIKPHTVTPSL